MSKTKLYIDCQFFQTEVWDRGMGRYARSLIGSLYKEDDLDYVFVFSNHLPKNEAAIVALQSECRGARVVTLNLLTTKDVPISRAFSHNKKVLNEFIQEDNQKDSMSRALFLIPCLFQEPTASIFPDGTRTGLIYYDAIPLLYYQRYRNAIDYAAYLERYKVLYQSETIFTISQTIADDLAIYLGITANSHQSVVNIDGACNESMFSEFKEPSVAIKGKYILLPSSSDIRKNNIVAVKAFEQVRSLTQEDYSLVITSTFTTAQRKQLLDISSNIIFTGNIVEEELAWLYKHSEAVLFTSEYEGLGLPVLEAVKVSKRVACSNIPVFREISEEAFYYFDPLDVQEVALALSEAISGKNWAEKKDLYQEINEKYQWSRSARIVAEVINKTKQEKQGAKPRLAICSPVPDGYSAIGKVVQELHDVTADYFDVDYYFENKKSDTLVSVRPNYLESIGRCYSIDYFNAQTYRQYDAVLYHIGNSEYHFDTILRALYLPGIAVFHDTVLKEAFGEMVRLKYITPERLEAEAQLDAMDTSPKRKSEFITSLANNQIATITHSKYASDALDWVLKDDGSENVRAHLPVVLPERNVIDQSRKKVHIGLGGVLTSNKGLDIIKKLALDKKIASRVVIHVFGFNFVDPTIVDELAAYKNVHLTTNLSDLEYQTQLSNLDVLINFRTSYRGETSLTVLEAMRYGCAVIVNGNLGWFSELPDATVYKVSDQDELLDAVRNLVESKEKRKMIGEKAREYVRSTHTPKDYLETIARVVGMNKDSRQSRIRTTLKENTTLKDILEKLGE